MDKMKTENLIPAIEFCTSHDIEFSFIYSLQETDLIELIIIEETIFLNPAELPKLEQILRLHRELEINLEGIDVIINLLDRVEQIQYEMNVLKNKLRKYDDL
jgi:hypothetical protein